MKTATVIQHVAFEDLGIVEPLLKARGFAIHSLQAGVDDLTAPSLLESSLLVVLGGPISVNDEHIFPFLQSELALLTRWLGADRPCLGICLGAQLMCKALGGSVSSMKRKEIGWAPLDLTEAGKSSALAALADTHVLHWHGEEFTIPNGAERLASSELCPNQAFAWQRNGLALQFHLEVDASRLERWYIGHIGELSAAGFDVPALREAAARHAQQLAQRNIQCVEQWLDTVGL
ncbi:MAG: glutamine amidotransferase [Polyangiaceae bacterium]